MNILNSSTSVNRNANEDSTYLLPSRSHPQEDERTHAKRALLPPSPPNPTSKNTTPPPPPHTHKLFDAEKLRVCLFHLILLEPGAKATRFKEQE